ncbi:MAG: NUDIX hydrolase [Hyphomicrobiales bacterium]|nr:NUDIX hydrolase [Hyphomicrobiales bacterium]
MNDNPGTDDYARRLTVDARERRWPNVRPKDAATLIILDRSAAVPKVLMGRRHPNHKFMPGKFVFPGGRIEAGDRQMNVTGMLAETCEIRLMKRVQRPTISRARALALAAIRETFEETGLLFGSAELGRPENAPPGPWSDFAAHGVYPDLEAVTFIARAITPPRRPKRFDARFFSIDHSALAHKLKGVVGPDSELDQLVWVTFEETRAIELPEVTRVVLDELADRIAKGFGPFLPVPFYYELNRRWIREEL